MADPNKPNPIANPLLVLREEFDDWAVLFDPDSGTAVGLNPVSVFIFKLLDGSRSNTDILRSVKDHFEDVSPDAEEHLEEFVRELVKRGFVGYEVDKDQDRHEGYENP
jgi:SynChlorMet cassette protein ScmD